MCALKYHPIQAPTRPFIDYILEPLARRGYYASTLCDLPATRALLYSPLTDKVHMTGAGGGPSALPGSDGRGCSALLWAAATTLDPGQRRQLGHPAPWLTHLPLASPCLRLPQAARPRTTPSCGGPPPRSRPPGGRPPTRCSKSP